MMPSHSLGYHFFSRASISYGNSVRLFIHLFVCHNTVPFQD